MKDARHGRRLSKRQKAIRDLTAVVGRVETTGETRDQWDPEVRAILERVQRPAWQRRVLHAVSPRYRARCRDAEEFGRLVRMAHRALEREQAGPQVDGGEKGTHQVSTPEGFADTETPDKGAQDLRTPEVGTQIVGMNEGDQR